MAWSGTVFQANTHLDDVYGGYCVFAEAGTSKTILKTQKPIVVMFPMSQPIPQLPIFGHVHLANLAKKLFCVMGILGIHVAWESNLPGIDRRIDGY